MILCPTALALLVECAGQMVVSVCSRNPIRKEAIVLDDRTGAVCQWLRPPDAPVNGRFAGAMLPATIGSGRLCIETGKGIEVYGGQ